MTKRIDFDWLMHEYIKENMYLVSVPPLNQDMDGRVHLCITTGRKDKTPSFDSWLKERYDIKITPKEAD